MSQSPLPFDRRDFLKGLLGGTAAATLGLGLAAAAPAAAQEVGGSVYNVRDFGALGDGRADDTAAIQAAITALNVAGRGSLYLPAGTYLVSQALELLSNTNMYGDGMGATILKLPNGLTTDVIGLVRTSGISDRFISHVFVSDLTLDGNRQAQTQGEHFGFYCGVKDPQRHANIGCWRVEIRNFRGYGFDPHEIT
ncbi:MAG: glycoside hydrolase family 55 protein, partial [Anaerolineae bacterium]|nr:glycoside hydrolase family 55 protein [Anaerolineae bacterium]